MTITITGLFSAIGILATGGFFWACAEALYEKIRYKPIWHDIDEVPIMHGSIIIMYKDGVVDLWMNPTMGDKWDEWAEFYLEKWAYISDIEKLK